MNYLLLENYIKSIIEKIDIDELHVFDFDMTLYDNNKESWIQEIIDQLKQSLANPKIRVILCTACPKKEQYILETEELLHDINLSLLDFDDCYFKSINKKESTPHYKSNVILDEVCANKNILTVKFWDDRADTLKQVKKDLEKYNPDIIYIPVKC